MGIFSSKTKRYVDTQISRVIDDEQLPTPLKTAVFEAIYDSEGDITTSLKNAALNGKGRKFERMYRHAKRGDYIHGLPDLKVLSTDDGYYTVMNVIYDLTSWNHNLEFEYIYFRPINNNHMAWRHLYDDLEYDHINNEIKAFTPDAPTEDEREPRYLTKIVSVHKGSEDNPVDPQSMGSWGRDGDGRAMVPPSAYTDFDFSDDIGDITNPDPSNHDYQISHGYEYKIGPDLEESAEIHFYWDEKDITYDDDGNITKMELTRREDYVILKLSQYDPNAEYYQAKYSYEDSNEELVWNYWFYDPAEGTHPELEDVYAFDDYRRPGTYFPFAMFRSEQEDKTIDDGSEEFKSTSKLLDYIDIDFESLGEAMHADENEGVEDLRQAVLMMAVPLDGQHEVEMEYLFEFFTDIHTQIVGRDPDAERPSIEERSGQTGGARDVSYALEFSDADFSLVISFDQIKKNYKISYTDIGPVGAYQNELASEQAVNMIPDLPIELIENDATAIPKQRIIRKQVVASVGDYPGIIEEIIIDNPVFKTVVREMKKKDLVVEGGVDDERLLIPLNYEVCQRISSLRREVLYFRSLHFVMNSYVEHKVKWWQRGIFKVILVIVAIVIAWFSGQWQLVIAAAGSAGAVALVLLQFILEFIFMSMLIDYAFQFVVEAIGVEAAFWLAIAATLVGGYKALSQMAGGAESISQTAMNYLKAASGLHGGISSKLQSDMESLQAEQLAYEEEMEEKQEELDELNQQLISPVNIDPLYFVRRSQPFTLFGEPPDAYFERTAHSGNVGVKAIDMITNYVDAALTLPKPEQGVQQQWVS